jgi:phosphatidylglycerol:prolipoprotein diacylglycerol transferase
VRESPSPVTAAAGSEGLGEPEALVVSHWFEAGHPVGGPYAARLRLSGRRVREAGRPDAGDSFVHEERIEGIVPGSGAVSASSWIYGLRPGDWNVEGELLEMPDGEGSRGRIRPIRVSQAQWSWRRWAVEDAPVGPVHTRWALAAPLAMVPGVVPGSYTALFGVGVVLALVTQAAIIAHDPIAPSRSILVSLLALAVGLLAAKIWYAALHPGESIIKGGWAVDGFLVVAPVVAIGTLLTARLPIGPYLDAATPGLFFAIAIGRVGCFLTGCCAGRCTASRFGVWSSDRRVGARRIPTQLLESGAGLVLALVSLPLVVLHVVPHGLVFAATLTLYLAVRQALLPLRAESRKFLWRRSEFATSRR